MGRCSWWRGGSVSDQQSAYWLVKIPCGICKQQQYIPYVSMTTLYTHAHNPVIMHCTSVVLSWRSNRTANSCIALQCLHTPVATPQSVVPRFQTVMDGHKSMLHLIYTTTQHHILPYHYSTCTVYYHKHVQGT